MTIGIIGAGIIGLTVAREYKKRFPDSSIVIIEKNDCVFSATSRYNSGVIHSGIHQKTDLLKSRLAPRGGDLLLKFCSEHGVPLRRAGMLIAVAQNDLHHLMKESSILARLYINSIK